MSNPVTIDLIREHRDALLEKFGKSETIAYPNVTSTQLSVARYYGGCMVNGQFFFYNPGDDSLIREDVVKWLLKRLASERQEVKPERVVEQAVLDFGEEA